MSEETEKNVSNSIGMVILIIFVAILTCGISVMGSFIKDGMKGRS
jgi:hypothetical protein